MINWEMMFSVEALRFLTLNCAIKQAKKATNTTDFTPSLHVFCYSSLDKQTTQLEDKRINSLDSWILSADFSSHVLFLFILSHLKGKFLFIMYYLLII